MGLPWWTISFLSFGETLSASGRFMPTLEVQIYVLKYICRRSSSYQTTKSSLIASLIQFNCNLINRQQKIMGRQQHNRKSRTCSAEYLERLKTSGVATPRKGCT